jgi:protein SCO1/2
MVSQDGKPFDSKTLAGRVWIADFIFTNCPGPCLRMSAQMHKVQSATAGTPQIRLLSFTVDPARDSPPVLAAFASRYEADPARWTFLTGKQETLQMLSRDTFKLGDVDGSMNHSTRFVLVDKRGRVRGIYGTQDGDPVGKVTADAVQLQKENS